MKTTTEIKREVFDLMKTKYAPTSKEYKAAKKRMDYLSECILYLETMPTPEFLQREAKRLEGQIAYIDKQFEIWITSQHLKVQAAPQKAKKTFEEKAGVPKLRQQLSTIEFLLD